MAAPPTHDAIDVARRQAVDRAVDHILTNLSTRLDLSAIAAHVGYSPWHFQRVFSATMSESPAAFVARARVERAVSMARAEPDRPWFEIAAEVGFASPSQLSRAFHTRFGLAARTWDRRRPLVDRDPDPTRTALPPAKAGGAAPTVSVVREPGYRFAYLRVARPYEADHLVRAWETVTAWSDSLDPTPTLLGMSWDDPATVAADLCRYDLGVALGPDDERPAWLGERWMPSTPAATVRVDGDLSDLGLAWEHLHRVWLPSSRFRRSALPSIERFLGDPRPTWTSWSLECVLPLAARRV